MLHALRRRNTVPSDLARALAMWLVVVLLVQAHAALQTLVRGPAHRHAPASVVHRPLLTLLPLLTHRGVDGPQAGLDDRQVQHQLAHERGQAHHHAGDEVALPAEGVAALDAAACVLMATLAPLAAHFAWPAVGTARTRPVAAAGWAWLDRSPAPPRRPPRG